MNKEKTSINMKMFTRDANFVRLFIVFVAVFIICTVLKGSQFLNLGNFQSMMKQFPEYGLLAVGISLALLIGGIDLSVVYIANLSAIIAGKFLLSRISADATDGTVYMMIFASFGISLSIGALAGALNGYLISGFGIPAMLATLGTQSLFWGFGVVLTGGSSMSGFPKQLSAMFNRSVGIVPVTVILFAIAAIVVGLVVYRMILGRQMKMYGTNNIATVYTGLNNKKLVISTHVIIGVLAALSGLIMWGRYSSSKPDNGATYTMQAILIAVMGGVSPNGGKGNIQGVVLAVLIIQMVSSVLNMFNNIPTAFRQIFWGGLLLIVMIFNYVINNRSKRRG
ncbi:MAG: ABC transporter permease [Lacrimispora sp.]|uniref:ABC transporter permease n=1 Tax=Lacrimispora sp. TaxID=2719234 RepID=UPI0039E40FB0